MINPLYQKTYLFLQVAFYIMAVLWAIHGNILVIVSLATVVFVWWAARVDRKLESQLQ